MAKREKPKAGAPTTQDYSRLIGRASALLGIFQRLERRTKPIFWWSIHVPEDVTAEGAIDAAQHRWAELLQQDYDRTLVKLGGIGVADAKDWRLYGVTGQGVTLADYEEIADGCIDAANRLGLVAMTRVANPVKAVFALQDHPLIGHTVTQYPRHQRQRWRQK